VADVDALVDLEGRPAVERRERAAFELELDGQDRAGGAPVDLVAGFAVAADRDDARVFEDTRVVAGGVLCFVVEPQARRDAMDACHMVTSWPLVARPAGKSTAHCSPITRRSPN